MDINAKKLDIIAAILQTNDKKLLAQIKQLIEAEYDNIDFQTLNEPEAGYLNAFWANLTPEQRAELEADIEEGTKELDAGEGIPHEEAIKHLKYWPKK